MASVVDGEEFLATSSRPYRQRWFRTQHGIAAGAAPAGARPSSRWVLAPNRSDTPVAASHLHRNAP